MREGDSVITLNKEIGTIYKRCSPDMRYDWWVSIDCCVKGEWHTVREPYRENELQLCRQTQRGSSSTISPEGKLYESSNKEWRIGDC